MVQNLQLGGESRLLCRFVGHLELDGGVLQVGEGALQKHLALVHDAHMVAHVLQLPKVVAGEEHRGATGSHVVQQHLPDLPAHDGIQPVHRLIQHQILRQAAYGDPEGRLPLHSLAHAPDGLFLRQLKQLPQALEPLPVEAGIKAGVESGHFPNGGLVIIEPVIGNRHDVFLYMAVFIYRHAVY